MVPMPKTQRYADMVWRIFNSSLDDLLEERRAKKETCAASELYDAMTEECVDIILGDGASIEEEPETVRVWGAP